VLAALAAAAAGRPLSDAQASAELAAVLATEAGSSGSTASPTVKLSVFLRSASNLYLKVVLLMKSRGAQDALRA
jgi:hypothetical protein